MIKIDDFKSYIVKFKENCKMKSKIYLSDYVIRESNWYSIIIIIYDNCIFFINNDIKRALTKVGNTFLQFKTINKVLWPENFYSLLVDLT